MKTTRKAAGSGARFLGAIFTTLGLALLSACGLAMDSNDQLDRAEQAIEAGDFRAAIIDAKDVLVDNPDDLRGRLLLGRASVEAGDGAAAEKELRRAVELGAPMVDVAPDLGRALVLQGKFEEVLNSIPLRGYATSDAEATARVSHGNAMMSLDQPESARTLYESAIALDPDNLDAQLGIVSSHVAERNFLQASSALEHLLEAHDENPRVWVFSGNFNNLIQEFERAESNFDVAIELATAQDDAEHRVQAIGGIATSRLGRQDVEGARPLVEQLDAIAPNLIQTRLLVGRLAFVDGDWTIAQQSAQQVLNAVPDNRQAKLLLGATHLRNGSLTQAELHLAEALAARPDDVVARKLLTEARLQMQKAEEAQQTLAPLISDQYSDAVSLQMAARASLGRQNIDEALEYLRKNVEQNPGDDVLSMQLATVLIQSGNLSEAEAVLDNIDAADSAESAYLRDTLNILKDIMADKPDAALQGAQALVKDHANNAGAFELLGTLQLTSGDRDGATASFEQSLKLNPRGELSMRYLGEIDESKGDLSSAEQRYNAVVAQSPDAAWALSALGRIAFRKQDFDNAVSLYRRAMQAEPGNPRNRLNLARAEMGAGNPSRAIRTLEENIDLTMSDSMSAILLGTLKARSGDVDGALEIAERLQESRRMEPGAYALEGEIHYIDKNLPSADRAYDEAVARGPAKSHALRSHRIKRELGAPDAAEPLTRFLGVRPLDSEVRLTLADYYGSSGQSAKSLATYEAIIADEPNNPFALNNLAWAYFQKGDPRALDLARRARAAMPQNGSIVDTLGWILTQSGSIEEGEALLREAVDLSRGRPEIRYHHAVALHKLGKLDEARTELAALLGSDAQFSSRSDAEKLLSEL